MKAIVFDMDGTLADLYGVEDWLPKLRAEDVSPYEEAKAMWDMRELRSVVLKLMDDGWQIQVVTWLSKESTSAYKQAVRNAKKEWLKRHDFPYNVFHGVQYGTTKASCIGKCDHAILVDDSEAVRRRWNRGRTINPCEVDLISALEKLLAESY